MGISAHQDYIEIMALEGILADFGNPHKCFMAVIVTNGAGSPRDGLYAACTDEQIQIVRRMEQKKAAFVGEYSAVAFLDHSSTELLALSSTYLLTKSFRSDLFFLALIKRIVADHEISIPATASRVVN